jgi:hypothetical protein
LGCSTLPPQRLGSEPQRAPETAAERVPSFKVGPNYDIEAIDTDDQPAFDFALETTDCSDGGSGNSRCGHEYGTSLSQSDRAALLEYLKSL